MITSLAISIAFSSGNTTSIASNSGICKVYQAAPRAQATSRNVAFRGVGPKRLSLSDSMRPYEMVGLGSVSDPISTLLAPGFSVPFLVSAGRMSPALNAESDLKPISIIGFEAIRSAENEAREPGPVVSRLQTTRANHFAESTPLAPMEKRITISLSATPLETVVGILSKQAGINIVLASKPEQKVSLNVKEMPLGEALRHLAALAGIKVLKVKNTVVLADDAALKAAYPSEYDLAFRVEPAKPEPAPETSKPTTAEPEKPAETSKVLTLKFQNAGVILGVLQEFLKKQGVTAIALPGSVVPVLGGGSGGGTSLSGGQGGAQNAGTANANPAQAGGFDPNSRKLFVTGPAGAISQLEAILKDVDVPRQQVAITVSLYDVSDEAIKEQGISWSPGQFSVTENTNNNFSDSTFQRTGINFTASMKALQTQDKARLLSKPNVNVMDGETSSILIGERRQFPIVNGTTPNGQFIYSTQEVRVGITLDVTAAIAADGSITLAVKPEVSSIIGFLSVNGGNYPQVATRSSNNIITLKDGETAILGGLLREEDIRNFERMPLLSNIPVLGELFKSRRTEKKKSQLIISITPTLIKP